MARRSPLFGHQRTWLGMKYTYPTNTSIAVENSV